MDDTVDPTTVLSLMFAFDSNRNGKNKSIRFAMHGFRIDMDQSIRWRVVAESLEILDNIKTLHLNGFSNDIRECFLSSAVRSNGLKEIVLELYEFGEWRDLQDFGEEPTRTPIESLTIEIGGQGEDLEWNTESIFLGCELKSICVTFESLVFRFAGQLVAMLNDCGGLEDLSLHYCNLGGVYSPLLAQTLREHPSLKSLTLHGCRAEDQFLAFLQGNDVLTSLSLDQPFEFSNASKATLAQSINENRSLKSLELCKMKLDKEDLRWFQDTLRVNTSLKTLTIDLSDCDHRATTSLISFVQRKECGLESIAVVNKSTCGTSFPSFLEAARTASRIRELSLYCKTSEAIDALSRHLPAMHHLCVLSVFGLPECPPESLERFLNGMKEHSSIESFSAQFAPGVCCGKQNSTRTGTRWATGRNSRACHWAFGPLPLISSVGSPPRCFFK
jgi:hypothetical protein